MTHCGEPTTIDGKARYCESEIGHTGQHMTVYCGRRHYWTTSTVIRPSRCTAITACDPATAPYCKSCAHAEYDGLADIDGRTYCWEFNPRFGPRFWNSRGREITRPSGALWRAFEAWRKGAFGEA